MFIGTFFLFQTSMPVNSPCAGVIKEIMVEDGSTVNPGTAICKIEAGAAGAKKEAAPAAEAPAAAAVAAAATATAAAAASKPAPAAAPPPAAPTAAAGPIPSAAPPPAPPPSAPKLSIPVAAIKHSSFIQQAEVKVSDVLYLRKVIKPDFEIVNEIFEIRIIF